MVWTSLSLVYKCWCTKHSTKSLLYYFLTIFINTTYFQLLIVKHLTTHFCGLWYIKWRLDFSGFTECRVHTFFFQQTFHLLEKIFCFITYYFAPFEFSTLWKNGRYTTFNPIEHLYMAWSFGWSQNNLGKKSIQWKVRVFWTSFQPL